MAHHAHSFAERHPELKDRILEIAEQNSAFDDMCGRFGRLWDSLNELDTDPGNAERIRSEVRHLELEMLNLVGGGGRV